MSIIDPIIEYQGYTIDPHWSPLGYWWAFIIPPGPGGKIQTDPRKSYKGMEQLAKRLIDVLIEVEEKAEEHDHARNE